MKNRVLLEGPEGECVISYVSDEAIPVWYIDNWYIKNKHTVDIQSAIDALRMIKDWRRENETEIDRCE